MTSESIIEGLKIATESPSFHYNLAVLEAFQRSARKTEMPPGFLDTQREVIIIGGSLGKGTGHFISDLDILDVTTTTFNSREWVMKFRDKMPDEFFKLLDEAEYSKLKAYVAVSNELVRRQQKRDDNVLTQEEMVKKRPYTKELVPAVAERAGKLQNDAVIKKDSYAGDWSIREGIDDIHVHDELIGEFIQKGTKTMFKYGKQIIAILTAIPNLTAYELTPGNLNFHQLKIISSMQVLYKADQNLFALLYKELNKNWVKYKSQTPEAYPKYFKELQTTRLGRPYLINKLFDYEEFPNLNELEVIFNVKKLHEVFQDAI